jgi:hypothetical protein
MSYHLQELNTLAVFSEWQKDERVKREGKVSRAWYVVFWNWRGFEWKVWLAFLVLTLKKQSMLD